LNRNSARCLGHKDAKRHIRNDAGAEAFLNANVAVAVVRFSDHWPMEINMLAPHHVFIPIAQFAARHRVAIIIVAAFLRIPRVRQHYRRNYQMFHG
jgi:hypothetical protein